MGLIIPRKEFKNGLTLDNIYCKVLDVQGSQSGLHYSLGYFASYEDRLNGANIIEKDYCSLIPNNNEGSPNHFKQCYDYLKQHRDSFKDAVDC